LACVSDEPAVRDPSFLQFRFDKSAQTAHQSVERGTVGALAEVDEKLFIVLLPQRTNRLSHAEQFIEVLSTDVTYARLLYTTKDLSRINQSLTLTTEGRMIRFYSRNTLTYFLLIQTTRYNCEMEKILQTFCNKAIPRLRKYVHLPGFTGFTKGTKHIQPMTAASRRSSSI